MSGIFCNDVCYDRLDNIEQVLSEAQRLMTIIVALKENDTSVLLAADGGVLEGSSVRLTTQKLQRHDTRAIAWSFTGFTTVEVNEFNNWLQSDERPNDWLSFAKEVIEGFAKLNGRQLQLVTLSGRKPTQNDTVLCLLAGWMDKPEILELNAQGKATFYWKAGFQAIGAGQEQAYAVYKTLSKIGGFEPLETIKMIMEIVTTTATNCDKPYSIWRITPKGISVLESGENAESEK